MQKNVEGGTIEIKKVDDPNQKLDSHNIESKTSGYESNININSGEVAVHPPQQELQTIRNEAQRMFYTRFPILLSDIKTDVVGNRLIFGKIMLEISGYEKNPDTVRFLWNEEAVKAKRLIHGLIVVKKRNVDLQKYSNAELISELEAIGHSHSP